MAIDFEALKAKLKAQAAVKLTEEGESNGQVKNGDTTSPVLSLRLPVNSSNTNPSSGSVQTDQTVPTVSVALPVPTVPVPTITAPAVLGTAKTTEIDHLDFLSKMNRLAEAIHIKHPTMPVLLMQIHKQLRADPELVTTLDEDAIGIVVSGLQIVTKTELVSVALKESKTKAKKVAISVDMF
jgi:hypothetical protein